MPAWIKASDHRASQQRHERKRDDGHDCERQPLLFGPGFVPIQERKHSGQEDSKNDPPHHGSCKDSRFSCWRSGFIGSSLDYCLPDAIEKAIDRFGIMLSSMHNGSSPRTLFGAKAATPGRAPVDKLS
jgi:hypothetical protein